MPPTASDYVTREELAETLAHFNSAIDKLDRKIDRFFERQSERNATPWGAIVSALIGSLGVVLVIVTVAGGAVVYLVTDEANDRAASISRERDAREDLARRVQRIEADAYTLRP